MSNKLKGEIKVSLFFLCLGIVRGTQIPAGEVRDREIRSSREMGNKTVENEQLFGPFFSQRTANHMEGDRWLSGRDRESVRVCVTCKNRE